VGKPKTVKADVTISFYWPDGDKHFRVLTASVDGDKKSTLRLRQLATLLHGTAWSMEDMADEIERERNSQ
jgi:hypothetical protein